MMRVLTVSLLAAVASAQGMTPIISAYDPENPTEPFDTMAKAVSSWLMNPDSVPRRQDNWREGFCNCMENGYVSSWYQYAPAVYLVDTCNVDHGFVLRTGHMQDRHTEPLQAAIACDTLKLTSYCLSHHVEELLPMFNPTCKDAHYTVHSCDVNCSAAVPRAGGRGGVLAAAVATIAVALATLTGA